jgi:hypothetical protein
MNAKFKRRPAIGRPLMATQIGATLLKRGRARSVIAFRREQRMATAHAIVQRLGEGAGIDAPLQRVDLAAAGRRPAPRGQGVDRLPGLIFGVVVGNNASIDQPVLKSLTPCP